MTPLRRNRVLNGKTIQLLSGKGKRLFNKLTCASESSEYANWRQEFLRKRLRVSFRVGFPCFLTFAIVTFYDALFPLKEMAHIPQEIKSIFLLGISINALLLLACFVFQNTWGDRYPAVMFLLLCWSCTIVPQIIGTIKGIPYPDFATWRFAFITQAIFVPVCWRLHLISQLVTIGYYLIVNSALGLTTFVDQPIYNIEILLSLFWYCFIGDLGVYLYEKLQKAEFESRRELRVFLHSVSHDLRNPVLGTSIVLENMLKKSSNGQVTVSDTIIERLLQASDRQLNLLNSLVEAHETEVSGITLKTLPIELIQVVKAVISDLDPILTKNKVILNNKISAELPLINADATQLWRVFSNLIANALKHNPPGISLTLNAVVEGKIIYCTVQDNGVGIPPSQCDRLFELYSRGSRARYMPGLGLGLYLCKQIITAHGGEIGVISHLGEGSTFWFTLPLVWSNFLD